MHQIIFAVLVVLLICALLCSRKRRKCLCPRCQDIRMKKINDLPEREESMIKGLHDLEQTPISRGIVPDYGQPDHVSNMWKSDYSHARQHEGAGYLDTVFASDYPTPLRCPMKQRDLNEISNSHLIARFANTQ